MARGGPRLEHGRRLELGQSFQDGGEHYQRVRPDYPADSADEHPPADAVTIDKHYVRMILIP